MTQPIKLTPAQLKRLQKNLTKKDKKEKTVNKDEHRQRHIELHKSLDELIADFIEHTGKYPSGVTLMEFMKWSYEQTKNPTEDKPVQCDAGKGTP